MFFIARGISGALKVGTLIRWPHASKITNDHPA